MNYPNELVEAVKAVADAINGGGGGGGSENSKEVITGTASTIFSDMGYDTAKALALACSYNEFTSDVSILFELDTEAIIGSNALGYIYSPTIENNNIAVFKCSDITFSGSIVGAAVEWQVPIVGTADFYAKQYINNEWIDVSAIFASLPITLTIYHHPMPEE